MNDIEVLKLLGQSGIAVAALAILARIVYRVGERLIAAVDRIGDKIDLLKANIGDMRQDLAVLGERVDNMIDFGGHTPVGRDFVESLPIHAPVHIPTREGRRTPPRGIPRARTAPERPERPDGGEYSERPERDKRGGR